MAIQLLEAYQCYQARVYPRGPGQTKCFSIAEFGDTGARSRAQRWFEQHQNPPAPKPATSGRSSSGLRGIGFKWQLGVLVIVVSVNGRKTTRSVREHGAQQALLQSILLAGEGGVPRPSSAQLAAALRKLRAELRTGAPKGSTR